MGEGRERVGDRTRLERESLESCFEKIEIHPYPQLMFSFVLLANSKYLFGFCFPFPSSFLTSQSGVYLVLILILGITRVPHCKPSGNVLEVVILLSNSFGFSV